MVLLTDGNQTGVDVVSNQTPLVDAIQPIKDLGVKVIAIGIGSVDRKQLATLVTDNDDILQPKNFSELLTLVKTTVGRSCRGMNFTIYRAVYRQSAGQTFFSSSYSAESVNIQFSFLLSRRIKTPGAI